ncbi:hypothetical protein CV019_02355, partial [Staphylococcus haemolyticus]
NAAIRPPKGAPRSAGQAIGAFEKAGVSGAIRPPSPSDVRTRASSRVWTAMEAPGRERKGGRKTTGPPPQGQGIRKRRGEPQQVRSETRLT